ncbi:uncharacterized protein SCHCODRAFT_02645523 [Schizophyllum commune H4-8]|uniref:uncharacterized protein n=1 Tax=Schizophyllum commune (strain H4-8 / FGSC 9210) TaxID=578458 RepID=UPI002160B51E|nr:uncharacterized protein SCHCODRAFT_02645523 [Schizophyllum commune H4-8]KAI5884816.1 hypothetical protein SCHCODRAFT_02645523 [Schizophyllum commune H4-8]
MSTAASRSAVDFVGESCRRLRRPVARAVDFVVRSSRAVDFVVQSRSMSTSSASPAQCPTREKESRAVSDEG